MGQICQLSHIVLRTKARVVKVISTIHIVVLWLDAMHSGKKVMNSGIRSPFYKFFLNPDYVTARSLRSNKVSYYLKCWKWSVQSVVGSLSTLRFINIPNLTRWNANPCNLLRTTCLIFEAFQILFPTASLIFTAVKIFIKWHIRKNEA